MLDENVVRGIRVPLRGHNVEGRCHVSNDRAVDDAEAIVIEATQAHSSFLDQRAEQGVGFHPLASGCFLN